MHRWHWMAMAGSLAAAAPLAAQVTMERNAPSRAEVRTFERVLARRARLGVKVNLQARATDSIGAYVEAVTPGGPAEKAGLRSGDVLTKLDGTSLLGPSDGAREGNSLPGTKLIELAARLGPNDTVEVQYRRGTEMRTATLVTQGDDDVLLRGALEPRAFTFNFRDGMPEAEQLHRQLDRMRVEGFPGGPMRVWVGGPLADLELAPLNADLGQYFGATEGVLVIDVPKDSPLGLKGGDVLLAIDGRRAGSPGQAHRILQSYDGDEAVKLEVLRNRKKVTLTGRMPKAEMLRTPGPRPPTAGSPKGERTWFEFAEPMVDVELTEVRTS